MGRWGAGLYDDDKAADLRQSVALIATIPASGDRLLEFLLGQADWTPELTESDGRTFWLVVADQFERRGIRCRSVVERALMAIDSGAPSRRARKIPAGSRSPSDCALRDRSGSLQGIPSAQTVVGVGEVYAFPPWPAARLRPT